MQRCIVSEQFLVEIQVISLIKHIKKMVLLIKETTIIATSMILINQLNHTVDVKERHNISNDIIKLSSRDVPNSYIAYNDQIVAANSKVKNYKVNT